MNFYGEHQELIGDCKCLTEESEKKIYMLHNSCKDSRVLNRVRAIEVNGKFNIDKAKDVVKELLNKHDQLRVSYSINNDNKLMKVLNDLGKSEFYIDERKLKDKENLEEIIYESIKPIQLNMAPLFRVIVVKIEEERNLILFYGHKIVCDEPFMDMMVKEFSNMYVGEKLSSIKDFSLIKAENKKEIDNEEQSAYWAKELEGELSVLNMLKDFSITDTEDFRSNNVTFVLNKKVISSLENIMKNTDSSLYTIMFANFSILLSKYCGQEEILVADKVEAGNLENTLIIRSKVNNDYNFNSYVKYVDEKLSKAHKYKNYDLTKLLKIKKENKEVDVSKLFQAEFEFKKNEGINIENNEVKIKSYNISFPVEKANIKMTVFEGKDDISISFSYKSDFYKKETIERMVIHFKNIIKCEIENPLIKLKDIELIDKEEKDKLLFKFNNTKSVYPSNNTISQVFEEQCEKYPNKVAIVFEGEKLTYSELNKRANALAGRLKNDGVGPDVIVGIMVEKSIEMIVGIIAILKAGGAYMPIDPDYPIDRIEYMLSDSKSKILLLQNKFINKINYEIKKYDLDNQKLYGNGCKEIDSIGSSSDLAYVIYTSGTTGKPKGVEVIQKGVVRLVKNTNYIEFGANDKMLQTGSFAFDASTIEIWGALLNGLTLYLVDKEIILNVNKFKNYILENEISIVVLTAPLFNKICETDPKALSSIKSLLVGGDVVSAEYVRLLQEQSDKIQVINAYGPTENTTNSTCYKIPRLSVNSNKVPIGKPIANSTAYIFNKDKKLVPIGVVGELYVGGDGLARGYLNNKKLSDEKFVYNPYKAGDKIYSTGDLARWLPDGNIEFFGRIDNQVKIRGYRIELSEIENALRKVSGINETVVLVKGKAENKYLCAYYVSKEKYSVSEIRNAIKEFLPKYMIPSYFVKVDEIPLTTNGKIDKKALPEPDMNINTEREYKKARNKIEEELVSIWEKVLKVNLIGIGDNFFELGGHSLMASEIVADIKARLNVEIKIKQIFDNPTIEDLAHLIKTLDTKEYRKISRTNKKKYYKVSSAEKRMFVLWNQNKDDVSYNTPIVKEISCQLDEIHIKGIIYKLVERHEILRTSFHVIDGEIYQRVHKKIDIDYCYKELNESEAISELKNFVRPFDLTTPQLMRCELIKIKDNKYIFMIDFHHIIVDGVSVGILFDEFMKLYKNENLDVLKLQYKDYSEWQNSEDIKKQIKSEEDYWISKFSDNIPILNIPTDYERPKVRDFKGNSIKVNIDENLTKEIKTVCKNSQTTLYIVLLTAYIIMLNKYSGQEDIVVGTVEAGRSQSELNDIVGMFVNTVAIRNKVTPHKILSEFLQEVKNNVFKDFENTGYQFDDLIQNLNIYKDSSRNPLFDAMFVLENINGNYNKDNKFVKNIDLKSNIAMFDLSLIATEKENKVELEFEYATSLYKEDTINRMAEHYLNILSSIINNYHEKLCEINMLSPKEKNIILNDFNDTNYSYPKNDTVQSLFEKQVKKTPNKLAVVYGDNKLTYKELNERANSLARTLIYNGAKKEDIIGIMMKPSLEMFIAIIATLKSGAAYMPIDISYPESRKKYMIENSRAKILLTENKDVDTLQADLKVINLDNEELYKNSVEDIEVKSSYNNLAYVIYTSGTTGVPKGVMVEHRSLINLCYWHNRRYEVTENDNATKYAGFGFDASVWEIFPYILKGATLFIIPEELRLDIIDLNEYYNKNNITISFLPTQICEQFEKVDNKSLRYLLTGADKLRLYTKKSYKLVNNYGPTESTVVTTSFVVDKQYTNIPIGKPIDNCKVYILGKNNEIQPIGVLGELCISGDSIARGYLNREDLTKEKFVNNIYDNNYTMYRTGDLARWLPDGNIEFFGRIDNQVKIRGYRIELGEIETSLLNINYIKEAVVITRDDINSSKCICAYITADKKVDIRELKNELIDKIPGYMIPTFILQVDEIPLTQNGKVNKKVLLEYELKIEDTEYVAPTTRIEKVLADVYKEILDVDKVGINDNYYELGGDSIKSIQIVSKLRDYNIKIEVKDIMKYASIKNLSKHAQVNNIVFNQDAVSGNVLLAPIQKWFINNGFINEDHFNQSFIFFKDDGIDEEVLKKSFVEILKHHDALRMCYSKENNKVVQVNRPLESLETMFTLNSYNLIYEKDYKSKIKDISTSLQKEVSLEEGRLIKLGVFRTKQGDYLLIVVHHMVIDGVSWRILIEDLNTCYECIEKGNTIKLPKKTLSYKEWNEKLYEYANSKKILDEKEYWYKILNTRTDVIKKDIDSDKVATFGESKDIVINISKEDTKALLTKVNKAYNTEINDILLSSLGLAINKWCASKKILVSLEGHGRENIIKDAVIDRTIGWFTSVYPIILDVNNKENISDVIKYTKEMLRHVPNKGIGYGILKYLSKFNMDSSNKKEAQVSFNYLGEFKDINKKQKFKFSNLQSGESIDLSNKKLNSIEINSSIMDGELSFEFNYAVTEYKDETIKELSEIFKDELIKIIRYCCSVNHTERTPWDYGDKDLTIEDLNIILNSSRNVEKIHSLTPMQEGMLYNYMKDSSSKAYYEQNIFTVEGNLDIEILNRVLNKLIEKYEILRTKFYYSNISKLKQVVLAERKINIEFKDISNLAEESKIKFVEEFKVKDKSKVFDLNNDVLIRVSAIKLKSNLYKLIFSYHHIIMDGWCLGILINDIADMYKLLKEGKEIVSNSTESYSNYLEWLDMQSKSEALSYWKKYLEGYKNNVVIPSLKRKDNNYVYAEEDIVLNEEITSSIRSVAKKNNVTVNAYIQTAWGVLLQKYNNCNDVVFGTVVSGRPAEIKNVDKMVGIFINTIPVRITAADNLSFIDLVKKTNSDINSSYKYSYCSLADIQSLASNNKLVNHILVYENFPVKEGSLFSSVNETSDIKIKDLSAIEQTDYDFDILIEEGKQIVIKLKYNINQHDQEIIKSIGENLYNILTSTIENYNVNVEKINMMSLKQKDKLINAFNLTNHDYSKNNKLIHELFEEQVLKTPDKVAIVCEDEKLTYKELNEKANSLARELRKRGVKQNIIVGLLLPQSADVIIGILAVLKAGGAYVPIDVEYPEDRKKYILEDSNAKVVISKADICKNLKLNIEIIDLDNDSIYNNNSENLNISGTKNDLVYVIYTSGSTGKPKGVAIEHKGLVNYENWFINKINLSFKDKTVLLSSYVFDLSYTALYSALITGCELHIISKDTYMNTESLLKYLEDNKITYIKLTPSLFKMLLASDELNEKYLLKSVRTIVLGGEPINTSDVEKYYNLHPNVQIYNHYGPTESTIGIICGLVEKDKLHDFKTNPYIGKPMDNTRIFILDSKNNIKPLGAIGELCISGEGLARGYVNQEKLTAEKFIANLFKDGERVYKTGDLARWLPDGNIQLIGRVDNQVKIRGFRVEIEEVENTILKVSKVKTAAVITKTDGNKNNYLCAYITSDEEIDIKWLRQQLELKLPKYMVPSYLMQIEKLPLNNNGKVNKKALEKIDISESISSEYVEPTNSIECKLVSIWKSVLKRENIGIDDDYFQLGGHSLNAVEISLMIRKKLEVEVRVQDIFNNLTIRKMSEFIRSIDKKEYVKINESAKKDYYEASSNEKRLYAIWNMNKESIAYNMPMVLRINKKLDKDRVEETLRKLVSIHEILRTSFLIKDEKLVQNISDNVKLDYKYMELTLEQANREIESFIKPFDLSKAPLMRNRLIKINDNEFIFMSDFHHIIADGISMNILTEDFVKLYKGEQLEKDILQYKDFSEWQNSSKYRVLEKRQEKYWLERFKGDIPELELETDFKRPKIRSFDGNRIELSISKELTNNLKKVAVETGSTLYMVLLTAYYILLAKYSKQEDIIVGTVEAGREQIELENTVGMFVNTLALRNYPSGYKTIKEFLLEVRKNTLNDLDNKNYQFEDLISKLDLKGDSSRNLLFDAIFVMENMRSNINDKDVKYVNNPFNIAKFDMSLIAEEKNGRINFNFEYYTRIFKNDTIKRMLSNYIGILNTIVLDINTKIMDIDILSQSEKKVLLGEFNNTRSDYPKEKTIGELFEDQVEKTPDNIAAEYENNSITYRKLNEKANSLAHILREKGVREESVVGIVVDRSIEMLIGIMAILKAGGAYLPIDPEFPEERKKYMLEDTKTKIILTQERFIKNLNYGLEIINLEDSSIYEENTENLEIINKPNNLAYIIYTSGSTGKPKGVLIEHRGVVRLVKKSNYIQINEKDIVLQLSNYAFDGSVFDIYGCLLNGGKLILINKNILLEVAKLGNIIKEKKVTVFFITTALFNTIVDTNMEALQGVRKVLFGGERISVRHAKKALNYLGENRLIHVYGPTEGTVYTTYYPINYIDDNAETVPIGKSISNSTAYVVGKNNELLPIGVPGELLIGGDGLARGYLNRKDLTKEKFIKNPFEKGGKLYRTGDIVKLLEDGNIQYIDRADNQIKIRGFRIEKGEIESKLSNLDGVKECIVIDRSYENEEKYLCAFITTTKKVQTSKLKEELSKQMPKYMIPSYIVVLDKLPVTVNGKIDKKALPEVDLTKVRESNYEAATNEIENILVEIWQDVLSQEKIGISDNFFELGGHSLKAAVITSKIKKKLKVDVEVKQLFEAPTIKEFAKVLENLDKKEYIEIKKAEDKEYYPVSSAEKRMFALWETKEDDVAYNVPMIIEIEEKVDRERIEYTLNELIDRHEILRTAFEIINGEIVQKVVSDWKLDFKYYELTESEAEKRVEKFVKPFDLRKPPLTRSELIKVGKNKYLFMIDFHHIAVDGVSSEIITKEFIKLYKGEKLNKIKFNYKDYSEWQKSLEKEGIISKQEKYWLDKFKNKLPILNLPTDYKRPKIKKFDGSKEVFSIDRKLTQELRTFAKETGSTLYMILLAAYNVMLSKLSGQEDIIVGTVEAGRSRIEFQDIVGMFVNTMALRNYPEGNKKISEFIKEVRDNTLNDFENKEYQFENLIEKLDIIGDSSRNPVFDVMFVLENMDLTLKEDSEKIKIRDLKFDVSKFDLTLMAVESKDIIRFKFEYSVNLFKKETIKKFAKYYENILKGIVSNIDGKIKSINMLGKEEERILLKDFNSSKVDYPKDKLLIELFEEQVEKTPDNIAVIFENEKLSYEQLNKKANSVGRILREKGVKAESLVGILVDRSIEMIIAIMAVLKAGGAYVPIDPAYPEERRKYMLEDSDAKVVLTQSKYKDSVGENREIINLDNKNIYEGKGENLEKITKPNNLAYIIYTSGTTGKPKGVMIENQSIVGTLLWRKAEYDISEKDNILILASYSFDSFVTSYFTNCIAGASSVLVKDSKDIYEIKDNIVKNKITHFTCVPALYSTILECSDKEDLKSIRVVTLAGDSTSKKIIELSNLKNRNIELVNEYGPTENSVVATLYRHMEKVTDGIIPIGKPRDYSKIYIVDKNNSLVPVGNEGELCIGGSGLARGYLNRDDITKEKFVDNPFEEGRMYKSGDLARWLPDGNIEFLGRIDHQIKIRGFRVEIEEIENVVLAIEEVKEVVVIAKDNENGDKYLYAFITGENDLEVSSIKKEIGKRLPDYMIPSYIKQIDKLPLTPNGKIDRKALAEIEVNSEDMGVKYEAPRNEEEKKIAAMWEEVLGKSDIGINDNFFELGGHSLKAAIITSKMRTELEVEIKVRDLFENPTIKQISNLISSFERKEYKKLKKAEEKEYYKASSAEKRIYTLWQLNKNDVTYNMPMFMEIDDELDSDKVEIVLNELIARHDILRTSFEIVAGELMQRVHDNWKLDYKYLELSEDEAKIEKNNFIKPFDLGKAPLIRSELIKLRENKYIFMIDMYHIICDGVSMGVLTDEFKKLYNGEKLNEVKAQYIDYTEWQNGEDGQKVIKDEEKYWLDRLSGDLPTLNIKTDYERPKIKSYDGDRIDFVVNEELAEKIRKLAKEMNTTIYVILIAAYNIMLSKYSNQEEILVGTVEAGRNFTELQNTVGMFVNTLVHRNYPAVHKTVREFLNEVKENVLNDFENKDYQFDDLIEKLNIKRDASRNPIFDVMFVLENMDLESKDDSKVKRLNFEFNVAKFDLTLITKESNKEIECTLEYCKKIFKKETIESMSIHYLNILNNLLKNQEAKLYEINMLSKNEEELIINKFNDTETTYPSKKTIQELFEEQVEKKPNNLAVYSNGNKLTYRELNNKANSLARVLIEKGIKEEDIVSIMVDKSLEMIIGIIGILKTGAAYLPIDPSYPEDRKNFMVKDSKTNIILSQSKYMNDIDCNIEKIDLQNDQLYEKETSNTGKKGNFNNLAYVIYTSGTTGNPKGVMIEQHSLVNLCCWHNRYYKVTEKDNATKYAGFSFDASVWEIFPYIISGASIYMVPDELRLDIEKLNDFYEKHNITVSFLPTQVCEEFIKIKNNSLRILLTGADKLKKYVPQKYKIYNNYGPTENTVVSTSFKVDNEYNNIPIGKPIDNCNVYILDKNNKLQSIGIPGELCISGDSLFRGYLNSEQLTKEKLVENPFKEHSKIYKTGDLGMWLPDGNIAFLGRIDSQVKIRGYRVELGEIETKIKEIAKVKKCIVLGQETEAGEKEIIAYYTVKEDISADELKAYLEKVLPYYMIPQKFIELSYVPINNNGKVDFKKLKSIAKDFKIQDKKFINPTTEVEKNVEKVFSKVLNQSKVSIYDNFFEIGGNSIKVISINNELKKIYSDIINVTDIFAYPTIYSLAQFIEEKLNQDEVAITKMVEVKYAEFPNEYIVNKEEENNISKLKFKVNDTFYENMKNIRYNFDVNSVLISTYMFMLSDICDDSKQALYLQIDKTNTIRELNIDMNEFEDFYDIVSVVKKHIEDYNMDNRYDFEDISPYDEKNFIVPLFTDNILYTYKEGYDLVIKVNKEEKELEIECIYNKKKLKSDKIKEFMNMYLNLLNEVVTNYYEYK